MARNTYQTYLMHSDDGTDYEKLIDIKSFPDLGGTPELLETTTLSDPIQTNILGIQSLDALEFTANYTLDEYERIKALEGADAYFAVWLGGTRNAGAETPTGSEGKFKFMGQLSVFVGGGGVNEVTEMTITVAASTPIELTD